MQKIISIALLVVYITLSVGLNIIVHTCGEETDAILATSTIEDPCGCGDESPADRCCTTEVTTVQLDDAQKVPSASVTEEITVLSELSVHTTPLTVPEYIIASHRFPASFALPPPDDLTILHSVLLI